MTTTDSLVSVDEHPELFDERVGGRRPAFFLDYDGTLTPIVERPSDAHLAPATRNAVARLAELCPVAIVSGRDRADVARLVGLDQLVYAGSHGFDIAGPDGLEKQHPQAVELLPALDDAERALHDRLGEVPGAEVERKRFSIAVHVRRVADDRRPEVVAAVEDELGRRRGLRRADGKMVLELRPDLDWDKGHAVRWLLAALGLDDDGVAPVYIGDDLTDEDAFRALPERGVGIVVRDRPRPTAAGLALDSSDEVQRLLERAAARLGGRR